MPNRTNVPTPPPGATKTTFQLGTYNATTDTFTLVLDLNDQVTWFMKPGTIKGVQKTEDVRSSNIRTAGDRVIKEQFRNIVVSATFSVRGATQQAILTSINTMAALVKSVPQNSLTLRIALPGATQYSYLDIQKGVTSDLPLEPKRLLALAQTGIALAFEGGYAWRGDRLTLQNLAMNAGFEAPMGGGVAQTAPLAFSDTLVNFNAYTVQAGGALAQDTFRYTDAVQSDGPRRYLRFGEPSGTTAFEVIGGNNGTIAGGVTLGVAGAIVGSADTAYTFNGSTGKVTVPTALLPTGNAAMSLECWFKFAANPASAQVVLGYGDTAHTSKAFLEFQLQTTGAIIFNCGANTVSSAAGIATGVYHHLLGTYDGTTMTFYVDGASVGTPQTPAGGLVIPASPTLLIGCGLASSAFFSGQVDEVAFYGSALSSARASAHFTTGHNTPTSTGNTMVIPAAGRVSFGSPVWSAMQTWQVRFRFLAGGTYSFYLHYADANNNLQVQVTSTTIALIHTVGGVAHTLVTSAAFSITLQTEVRYWVTVTQFPAVSGIAPYLTASLFVDSGGAMASQYASISAAAFDAVTAESGAPQMAASGAALGIGGAFSNVHAVFLFGPGAWRGSDFIPDASYSPTSYSWDGAAGDRGMSGTGAANTLPSGPVTSFGAARMDLAPSGNKNAIWFGTTSSNASDIETTACPVSAAGNVLSLAANVKSSGLGVSATISLLVNEFDATGVFLRQATLATLTGNQASWTTISGTRTTGASTAYAAVLLNVVDSTGASNNGIVWFDNVSVWNQTTTAQDGMPWCDLRGPTSPYQLTVGGIQGDVVAPCVVEMGIFFASWPINATGTIYLGRLAATNPSLALAGASFGAVFVLDGTSLGGFNSGTAASPTSPGPLVWANSLAFGTFHILARAKTANASPTTQTIQPDIIIFRVTSPLTPLNTTNWIAHYRGSALAPFTAQNTYTVIDVGQVFAPPFPSPSPADPATLASFISTLPAFTAQLTASWIALLPVDGGVFIGALTNGNFTSLALTNQWLYVYWDGYNGTTSLSRENAAALPNIGHAVAAFGSTANDVTVALPGADASPQLDPTQTTSGSGGLGVNQLLLVATDGNTTLLPVAVDILYTPQYLYPR